MTPLEAPVTEILDELARLGIRLATNGCGLRFAPRSVVTPELAGRLKTHKAALMAILKQGPGTSVTKSSFDTRDCGAVVEPIRLDGWPVDCIDLAQFSPCPHCGKLEFWQNVLGDWRCERCNPPTRGLAFIEHAERIRPHTNYPATLLAQKEGIR